MRPMWSVVVSAYLSAYNARAYGVRDYIAQLMFNSPPGLSDAMDLAKMLACLDLIAPLAGPDFRIWRQTRTGLLSYPLGSGGGPRSPGGQRLSTDGAPASHRPRRRPHRSPSRRHRRGRDRSLPARPPGDRERAARRTRYDRRPGGPGAAEQELVREAHVTLAAICALAEPGITDPLADPTTLARAVAVGLLDAPQLRNNPFARGKLSPG